MENILSKGSPFLHGNIMIYDICDLNNVSLADGKGENCVISHERGLRVEKS